MKSVRFVLGALVLATLAVPVHAAPDPHWGMQSGTDWSEIAIVPAQAGSTFVLVGIVGDHDVTFLDANGNAVGTFAACGPDRGIVPDLATSASILAWDHIGGIAGCDAPADPAPSSTWVYVDGL